MDEKPDQIMNHIESQRSELGRNLNELESRVKRTTDWRVQFDKNPMMMMGVALGGGLLLGSIVGGGKKSRKRRYSSSSSLDYAGRHEGSSSSSMTEPVSYGGSVYPTSRSTSGSTMTGMYSSSPASSGPATGDVGSSGGGRMAGASQAVSGAIGGMTSRLKSDSPAYREERRKASDTLDNIKAALIGFATTKVKEFMTEALPGFDRHMSEAEQRNRSQHDRGEQSGQQHRQESSQTSGHDAQRPSGLADNRENRERQGGTGTGQSSASAQMNQPAGVNTGANI